MDVTAAPVELIFHSFVCSFASYLLQSLGVPTIGLALPGAGVRLSTHCQPDWPCKQKNKTKNNHTQHNLPIRGVAEFVCVMKLFSFVALTAVSVFSSAWGLEGVCPELGIECKFPGSCEQLRYLTGRQRTCEGTLLDVSVTETCARSVAQENNCSSVFVQSSTNSTNCQCLPAGDICRIVATSDAVRVAEVAAPYCVCSENDDGQLVTGASCSIPEENSDFVAMLNGLNNLTYTGQLLLDAGSVAFSSAARRNYFNLISATEPAVILQPRGSDGQIKFRVVLDDDTISTSEWAANLEMAILNSLQIAGYSIAASQIRVVEGPRQSELDPNENNANTTQMPVTTQMVTTPMVTTQMAHIVPCHCPDIDYTCRDECYSYDVTVLLVDGRVLSDWELGLIIAACVIFVCVLAVGLSAVKTPVKEPAIKMVRLLCIVSCLPCAAHLV